MRPMYVSFSSPVDHITKAYNKSVKTNNGRAFISLIERSFPAGHKLRKIFNRNTIKLSYSCMPNVKQIIDGHNKAILKTAETAQPQKSEGNTCSCRKKEDCPLNGECLVSEVVYQATVSTGDEKIRSKKKDQTSRVKDLSSLVRSDDSCLAAIRHVQSIIRLVRPRPNIRCHSVLSVVQFNRK